LVLLVSLAAVALALCYSNLDIKTINRNVHVLRIVVVILGPFVLRGCRVVLIIRARGLFRRVGGRRFGLDTLAVAGRLRSTDVAGHDHVSSRQRRIHTMGCCHNRPSEGDNERKNGNVEQHCG